MAHRRRPRALRAECPLAELLHAECCHPYVNRDEQLSTLVAQLRGAYGRHLGEPAWTGFVRRLQARSPHFARLWAEQDVASHATYLKIFRHPAHERLAMTTTSLAVLAVPAPAWWCTRPPTRSPGKRSPGCCAARARTPGSPAGAPTSGSGPNWASRP